MQIKIVAYGIARDLLSTAQMDYEIHEGASIVELKDKLVSDYPEFSKLRSLAFAINEEYVGDDSVIQPQDEIVLIPPVSGG